MFDLGSRAATIAARQPHPKEQFVGFRVQRIGLDDLFILAAGVLQPAAAQVQVGQRRHRVRVRTIQPHSDIQMHDGVAVLVESGVGLARDQLESRVGREHEILGRRCFQSLFPFEPRQVQPSQSHTSRHKLRFLFNGMNEPLFGKIRLVHLLRGYAKQVCRGEAGLVICGRWRRRRQLPRLGHVGYHHFDTFGEGAGPVLVIANGSRGDLKRARPITLRGVETEQDDRQTHLVGVGCTAAIQKRNGLVRAVEAFESLGVVDSCVDILGLRLGEVTQVVDDGI